MIKLLTNKWSVWVLALILLIIYVSNPILLQKTRLSALDNYQSFGNNYESKSLILLDISDAALKKQGQWPWKRDVIGRTVINAYKNGAALVFVNLVFVHKDRLGGDEMFLKMISKYPIILTETKDAKNLTSIKRKVLGVGDVLVPVDVDGTIRKLPLKNSVPETILKVIKFPIPEQDNVWIDFRHNIPRVDYTDKDWSSMKGKIVFIGTTFKGSTFVLTPNGLKNTHEIMALSTETLLSGKYIKRPTWLYMSEIGVTALALLFFLLIIPRVGLKWSAMLYGGFLFEILLVCSYAWLVHLIIIDWIIPLIVVSIVWAHLIYNNFARENRLKLQIKKQFEHYLAPGMVQKLQKDPSLLKLGGERKELTFLFSDIRGFTPISEKFKDDPEQLTRYVNKFLTAMTDIILKNEGTIDKYMGDCIMAFWNAPIDCKNHRELAVKSAKEMKQKLALMNKTKEFDPPLNIGIGINTGKCLVGNMGSEQRFDYSVIGDAVNLASRLESSSKTLGQDIVISENTREPLFKRFNFQFIDKIKVKGKDESINVYTIKF